MIIISHRGNLNGSLPERENSISYIDEAINVGFDVEIDVWYVNNVFYLGHDKPTYVIDFDWILERYKKLWIHCKDKNSMIFFQEQIYDINYFWHENDVLTLTSKNFMWVYPNNQPIRNSIAVLPEINNDDISKCFGICTDYPQKYINENK